MSLLGIPEATPGRIVSVLGVMQATKGVPIDRGTLEACISPAALRAGVKSGAKPRTGTPVRDARMAGEVVNETLELGILSESKNGHLSLDPAFHTLSLDPLDEAVQTALETVIYGDSNDRQSDLAVALAWFLTLDSVSTVYDWDATERSLQQHFGRERLGLNDARFTQLRDWASYFGLAEQYALGQKTVISPDPTRCLMRHLPTLVESAGARQPFPMVIKAVGEIIPVLDGGRFHKEVMELRHEDDQPDQLSQAHSQAWLRLEESGHVILTRDSDAAAVQVLDGIKVRPASHVERKI